MKVVNKGETDFHNSYRLSSQILNVHVMSPINIVNLMTHCSLYIHT